jgi:hypothetical protein
MLLLTNGTVMVQGSGTSNWQLLTPDENGQYVTGTWSQLASSSAIRNNDGSTGYAPDDYASAVLADGSVIFAGGELASSTCAIYYPRLNPWQPKSPFLDQWLALPSPEPTPTSSTWQASHAYAINATIIDSNNHVQKVTTAGTSGTKAPTNWNASGGNTSDGGVTWTDCSTWNNSYWQPSQRHAVNDTIADASGHIQRVTTAGTSGSAEPTWNTSGGTTSDGTVIWTDQGPLAAFYIAGAPCCVLPDGRFLLGASGAMEGKAFVVGRATAIFDPGTQKWSNYADNPGSNWEASWTMLPDGTVLCPSSANPPYAYKYVPTNDGTGGGSWLPAGSTIDNIAFGWQYGAEIGPALLLLDGRVIAFGATGHNGVYTAGKHPTDPGTWTKGAEFSDPNYPADENETSTYSMSDAPAVLLPNGNALCIVGPYLPTGGGHSGPPALAFELDPASASTQQVATPPSAMRPPGETVVATMSYRVAQPDGHKETGSFALCGYTLPLDPSKTVKSITLPDNRDVVVLAIALVGASAAVVTPIDLSSAFNVSGIYTDGTSFSTGGLDQDGYAYSENQLGSTLTYTGTSMRLGPANAPNGVFGATVALPPSRFSAVKLLATAVNGNQPSQIFTVTFSDGTRFNYTQTLSDWGWSQPGAGAFVMLVLPTGEVLLTAGTREVYIYQPGSSSPPPASAAPTIKSGPTVVQPGVSGYALSGTQFNGLSQANSFGDDASMATNYPLVRIKNLATGHIWYCPTHDHSTMGVATGATEVSTSFDVPDNIELGPSQLCVVANGIPSAPLAVTVSVLKLQVKVIARSATYLGRPAAPKGVANVRISATISVTDTQSGSAIPNAVVMLDLGDGHSSSATTNNSGQAVVSGQTQAYIPPGTKTPSVEHFPLQGRVHHPPYSDISFPIEFSYELR